jgi:hypothetical protein
MNLLQETIDNLLAHEKNVYDVLWVGSKDGEHRCSWQHFAQLADREYDSGFGGTEVCLDLVVVGDGWWLERYEYDGSEWWAYKAAIPYVSYPKPVLRVFGESVRDPYA